MLIRCQVAHSDRRVRSTIVPAEESTEFQGSHEKLLTQMSLAVISALRLHVSKRDHVKWFDTGPSISKLGLSLDVWDARQWDMP